MARHLRIWVTIKIRQFFGFVSLSREFLQWIGYSWVYALRLYWCLHHPFLQLGCSARAKTWCGVWTILRLGVCKVWGLLVCCIARSDIACMSVVGLLAGAIWNALSEAVIVRNEDMSSDRNVILWYSCRLSRFVTWQASLCWIFCRVKSYVVM